MQNMDFNPRDRVSVISLLESLETPNQLLQYSPIIYSFEGTLKKDSLKNLIQFGDLTLEQLSAESNKVCHLIDTAMQSNIPLTESVQKYLLEMNELIDRRRLDNTNDAYTMSKAMLQVYESEVLDVSDEYVIESSCGDLSATTRNLNTILSSNTITPIGVLEACRAILIIDNDNINDDERKEFISDIIDKVKNTIRTEANYDKYSDFPIMKSLGYVKNILDTEYSGDDNALSEIGNIFKSLEDELDDLLESIKIEQISEMGFNPNPFSVYQMTPFNVGTRSLMEVLTNIALAGTDEQITEALLEFGRMETACEAFGESILTEGKGAVAKKAREMAHASNKFVNGTLKKAEKAGRDVKVAVKKTIDPMERFIESVIAKMKKADYDERRDIILSNRVLPKVMRWLKRVIAALIVGRFGNVGAIIAGISLIAWIATDKHFDKKTRASILRELEDEKKIVDEKIEDAKGDENKQKKYELMRIQSKLDHDMEKIQLRLKY